MELRRRAGLEIMPRFFPATTPPLARPVSFPPCQPPAKPAGGYCDFRLFLSVFRFCPNDFLRKLMKPASGTFRLSIRESIVSRTTDECTLGGGENESGGSVNSFSTRA